MKLNTVRDQGGKFLPGHPSASSGRPKSLATKIMELTDNGNEILQLMMMIMRGQLPEASLKDRMEAAKFLTDRGFGRALETVEVSGTLENKFVLQVDGMSERDLDDAAKALAKLVRRSERLADTN